MDFTFKKVISYEWHDDMLFVFCEHNEAYKILHVKEQNYNFLCASRHPLKELNELCKFNPCVPLPTPQNNEAE